MSIENMKIFQTKTHWIHNNGMAKIYWNKKANNNRECGFASSSVGEPQRESNGQKKVQQMCLKWHRLVIYVYTWIFSCYFFLAWLFYHKKLSSVASILQPFRRHGNLYQPKHTLRRILYEYPSVCKTLYSFPSNTTQTSTFYAVQNSHRFSVHFFPVVFVFTEMVLRNIEWECVYVAFKSLFACGRGIVWILAAKKLMFWVLKKFQLTNDVLQTLKRLNFENSSLNICLYSLKTFRSPFCLKS